MSPKYDFYFGCQEFPVEAVMPAGAQFIAEIVTGALTLATILWGIRNLLTKKDARLLILMLIGLIAVLQEVHVMPFWRFFYPPVGQKVLYFGLGRPVPIFTGFVYSIYFGWSSYLYLKFTDGNWSPKVFLKSIVFITVLEALMEIVFIHFGLWFYYDDQPFTILGFPIHVAFSAACFTMLYAEIQRIWFSYAKGWQQFQMIILGPMLIIALFTAYVYPVYFAFESSGGLQAARLGSLMSMGLSVLASYLGIKALTRRPAT